MAEVTEQTAQKLFIEVCVKGMGRWDGCAGLMSDGLMSDGPWPGGKQDYRPQKTV